MIYNEPMLKYNLFALQKLMDGIAVLTRAFVTIYADDFHPLKPFGATQQQNTKNIFCRNVKTQYHAKCTQSDVNAFKNFPENENFYYYRCHCGFIEIACRFYSNNTVLGYLLIGPFRDPLTEEKDVERINHLCEEHGFNRDEMLRSYYQIEPFSEEVFLALKNICPPLFDYYDMKNYISEKEDFFAITIEPFLQQNLSSDLSIETLCQNFFVSKKTLYKIFRTNVKLTPNEYIRNLRIEKALELLLSTDMPLTQISATVGIPDYNYFIKIFKSVKGNTPSHYRKNK